MTDRTTCSVCGTEVGLNKDGSLKTHGPTSERCLGGRAPRPKGVEAKAAAYIEEGRVKVAEVNDLSALILVRGSAAEPYECRWNGAVWTCTCESRVWRCSHVVAASQVSGFGNKNKPVIQQQSDLDVELGPRVAQVVDLGPYLSV